MGFRDGLHRQKILALHPERAAERCFPVGVTRGKYRKPFASTWMRAGSLNQSDCTLSFGSACLITHDSPLGRVSNRVLFDTPPLNFSMVGVSVESIRSGVAQISEQLGKIVDVNHRREEVAASSDGVREAFEVFDSCAGVENDDLFFRLYPTGIRELCRLRRNRLRFPGQQTSLQRHRRFPLPESFLHR